MSLNIRNYIKKNFSGADIDEIKDSISYSLKEKEEVTLPGLGVFFEIIWQKSDTTMQTKMLNVLKDNLKS